ncbi:hypothetical protein [Candidatus Mesenet endosymbiont of Agriotes lineatus]|uniref:hypothetical protein n=1 Tax=Candidatus Mesenet endosymbiont of Agriotes lineatus TaxID=3077948 RepID=UPI0030D556D0
MKQGFKKVAKKILLIPLYIVLLPFSVVFFLTRVLLFPKFFFSLWHKEGVKFSRVLGLFTPELLGKLNVISNFKAFLKMKNSDDKKPLSVLLHSWRLNTYDIYNIYYKDNLKYLERVRNNRELFSELLKTSLTNNTIASLYIYCPEVVTKLSNYMLKDNETFKYILNSEHFRACILQSITDDHLGPIINFIGKVTCKEKSQIIFNLLDNCPKNPVNHSRVFQLFTSEKILSGMNNISNMELFRAIFNKERFRHKEINGTDNYYIREFHNISQLCEDHALLSNLSIHFNNENKTAIAIAKICIENLSNQESVLRNFKILFADESLIESLSANFNRESSLVGLAGLINYFTCMYMDEEKFSYFSLMLKDPNVIENLKLIDDNYQFRKSLDNFNSWHGSRRIYLLGSHKVQINNLHLLLTNRKFFSKINSLPLKMLDIVFNSCLYTSDQGASEALELFDCLDDGSNKTILNKLVTAFETNHYALYCFVNRYHYSKAYYHFFVAGLMHPNYIEYYEREDMLKTLSDKRFYGANIREVAINFNLLSILRKNNFIDVDKERAIDCIFSINHIKECIYIIYCKSDLFLQKGIFLFSLFLEHFDDFVMEDIIKSMEYKYLANRKIISYLRNKVNDYFDQLLNFDNSKILFSDIKDFKVSNKSRDIIQALLGTNANSTKFIEGISNVKFMEFFTNGKYQEITQESLNKIQYLKIKDLPKTEKDKSYFQNQGITDKQDLSLLVNLAKESKTVISHIKYSANLQDNAMYIMHELFDDISINVNFCNNRKSNNRKQSEPAKLLDLCKINIVRSALALARKEENQL